MSKLNKISLLALLFIGSTLCVSFNAFAQLSVDSFLPAATETPAGSKYYVLNSPIPTNQATAWLQWNFSKGIDAKFVQDISNITVKEIGSSTEIKFDNSTGTTTSPAPGYEYDSGSALIQNADFTYLKVGSGTDPIQYRRLSLIPTTVIFEPNKTYVVTVDNETTLDNGTIRKFQANNGNILKYTYSFEFNTIGCTDADGDHYNIEGGDCGAVDCNDADNLINPGTTDNSCDGIDQNCDGNFDEDSGGPIDTYYRDADGDNYGNPVAAATVCTGSPPAGYVANSDDCKDNNSAVHPGAAEICNGIDDNCDGTIDTDNGSLTVNTFYRDADSDNYGDAAVTTVACAAPAGYVSDTTDCKDNNSAINPGASDANCDGIDNNCSDATDEGYVSEQATCGTGACASTGVTACVNGRVQDNCTEGPSTDEVCNGIDDDCNGLTDDGLTGTVLHVGASWPGSPYATIQQAVDAACAGDEIWVEQGTYTLSSTINISKAISLYGGFTGSETSRDQRNYVTNVTTIDGDNSTRCFLTKSTVTIDGFTITRGKTNSSNSGAGLSNGENSTSTPGYLTISNCIFINNTSGRHAGALYNDIGSVTVTNCTFTQNTAALKGGAVTTYTTPTLSPASNMSITGCIFSENTAKNAGAICINGNSGTNSITDTTFSKNTATPAGTGDGGAIMADESVTITRCIFDQNQAGRSGTFAGGGATGKSAIFTNCIFSGNSALNGAGICINGTSGALGTVTATNCTFTGNTLKPGGKGGAIYTSMPSSDAGTVFTVTNSILWGNAGNAIDRLGTTEPLPTVSYTDIDNDTYAGSNGNINSDPLFVDAENGDYSLQATSPCIDTGTSVGAPSEDIEKTARPQGAGYDMGAYEALCTAVSYRDADEDGYGNAADTTQACPTPAGYVSDSTDCNDNASDVNPGKAEVCGDGIDNNCDNKTDDNCTVDNCTDADGDGFFVGDNCTPQDCDDTDPALTDNCPTCAVTVVPRNIFKLFAIIYPIHPFVISADSGVEFARPIDIDWGTEAINDIIRLKIGKRIIIGFLLVRPLQLEAGVFDVTVTFGDAETICAGTIEVK